MIKHFFIRIYQYGISPMLGQNCRHTPTCSQYTAEAIQEWGILKGSLLGIKRLSKCHPWGSYGYDPIPKINKQTTTARFLTKIATLI